MNQFTDWDGSLGKSWSREWRRTDRSFGGLTEHLLRKTRDFDFTRVLDVGCGAGELSLAIARGRSHIPVVGLDISPQLVYTAEQRGMNLSNASFELGDASRWVPPKGEEPNFLVSRHGVMFFPDPVAAFTHLRIISKPGAGLLFSCFRDPSENEMFTGLGSLLPQPETPPDPHAPGPLAFADPARVRGILSKAGWSALDFLPVDYAMVVGAGEDPVADAVEYFLSVGMAARAAAKMDEEARKDLMERLADFARSREFDGIVALRAAAWIVTGKHS